MQLLNETSVFESPNLLVFYYVLRRLYFYVSHPLRHANPRKPCHTKAFRVYNNPTKFASLIDLFELGGVVHFGAADQIRTGDLILTKDALYRLSYSSEFGDPERARTVDL